MDFYDGGWAPYVSVAERRDKAQRKLKSLEKKGRVCQPVTIEGRAIARTFWGKKWCDNLEAYSDYASRLPRGRAYVRHGSVVDLKIKAGKITALVFGSEMYTVSIGVDALEAERWQSILRECAGQVASLVELLQGRLSNSVMEVVTRHGAGLFPVPQQIAFRCSCPDSASMCKHIAAALYGVGTRLDSQPELLFELRHVDPLELIRQAGNLSIADAQSEPHQQLDTSDLSALFGIELNESPVAIAAPSVAAKSPAITAKRSGKPARSLAPKAATRQAAQVQPAPVKKKMAALRQPRQKPAKTVTARDLLGRGIPRHMQQSWLKSGILLRTDERGVYHATKQTKKRIEDYLGRVAMT
ncbi:SWIM zinc finger family protein [Mycoavidus sp. HKI]|uniref:SWIM zinc finger family protein n=1 Tax=Mycoavidus sp. HKI TaxID=2840467 RepID=UPI001CC0B7C6|nr:SWIM zinc finger family protein [Mycoavidus sp. HKI]UAW63920.2 SWIM zinc finger family protein [Mycoavidus sp. HKI]